MVPDGPAADAKLSDEVVGFLVEVAHPVRPDSHDMNARLGGAGRGRTGNEQEQDETLPHGNTRSIFRQSWAALAQPECQSGLLFK